MIRNNLNIKSGFVKSILGLSSIFGRKIRKKGRTAVGASCLSAIEKLANFRNRA